MAAVETEEVKMVFSCKEAQLVLKVVPIEQDLIKSGPEVRLAGRHYGDIHGCDECHKIGLSEIISRKMECKEALELWAKKPGKLYIAHAGTLLEGVAIEHVMGRFLTKGEDGFQEQHFRCCQEPACQSLRFYWLDAPLSMFNDCPGYVAREIPFLIDLFRKEDWDISNLLEIQKQRLTMLVENLAKGRVPRSESAYYHELAEVASEITINLQSLYDLIKSK